RRLGRMRRRRQRHDDRRPRRRTPPPGRGGRAAPAPAPRRAPAEHHRRRGHRGRVPRGDGGGPLSPPALDWSDPTAVPKWLGALRSAIADADAIARDMLRPARDRELGPTMHREKYREAMNAIVQALDYATAPEPEDDDEPSDPAGSGGAGPVH